jgi:hypothetical protein
MRLEIHEPSENTKTPANPPGKRQPLAASGLFRALPPPGSAMAIATSSPAI